MPFLMRYELDESRPSIGSALRDLALRAVLPGLVVFAALVGVGKIIMGPLKTQAEAEDGPNTWAQSLRTPFWDSVTHWWSWVGNTEVAIPIMLVIAVIIYATTKQWWVAVIPGLAMALQASIFVAATHLTDRQRPDVPHLDPAPPTSSFPSGHVGAAFALYWSTALVVQRVANGTLRRVLTAVLVVMPFLVAWARLYRGMHHLSDIVFGALNGIVCVLIAWSWLRRDDRRGEASLRAAARRR